MFCISGIQHIERLVEKFTHSERTEKTWECPEGACWPHAFFYVFLLQSCQMNTRIARSFSKLIQVNMKVSCALVFNTCFVSSTSELTACNGLFQAIAALAASSASQLSFLKGRWPFFIVTSFKWHHVTPRCSTHIWFATYFLYLLVHMFVATSLFLASLLGSAHVLRSRFSRFSRCTSTDGLKTIEQSMAVKSQKRGLNRTEERILEIPCKSHGLQQLYGVPSHILNSNMCKRRKATGCTMHANLWESADAISTLRSQG